MKKLIYILFMISIAVQAKDFRFSQLDIRDRLNIKVDAGVVGIKIKPSFERRYKIK